MAGSSVRKTNRSTGPNTRALRAATKSKSRQTKKEAGSKLGKLERKLKLQQNKHGKIYNNLIKKSAAHAGIKVKNKAPTPRKRGM